MIEVLVGLLIAFGGADASRFLAARTGSMDRFPWLSETLASDLRKWVVAGLLVAYVLVVEGKSLASIGVVTLPPLAFLGWVVGGLVLTFALGIVAFNVFVYFDLDMPTGFTERQRRRPVGARLFTAITAGVTESVLYQGYPIERLAGLTGSVILAGAIAWVAFSVAHYIGDTFSLEASLFISVPAFSVTVLYVLSGNLLVVIVVHAAVDAISLLTEDPGSEDADPSTVEAAGEETADSPAGT